MKMLRTHRINHLNHHLCSQKVNHSQASQFKLLILTFLESVPPTLNIIHLIVSNIINSHSNIIFFQERLIITSKKALTVDWAWEVTSTLAASPRTWGWRTWTPPTSTPPWQRGIREEQEEWRLTNWFRVFQSWEKHSVRTSCRTSWEARSSLKGPLLSLLKIICGCENNPYIGRVKDSCSKI